MILLILIVAILAFLPLLIQRYRAEQHRRLLADQLRQSLGLMTHALRVGVGFQQAIAYAAKEGADPLAAEWRRLLHSVQIGEPLSQALNRLPEQVPLRAMRNFVAAVQITQSTGGSLAEVLETLAESLQDQQRLRDKVTALTAQGKVSGILLSALPFIVLAALYAVVPDMAGAMVTTFEGQLILAGMTASVFIGGLLIRHIVTVEIE